MNYHLPRNNSYYSFARQNTINYSNVRAHTNSNGQNGIMQILLEIRNLIFSLGSKIDSAKNEIIKSLQKKNEPSSSGNSAYSGQLIPPRNLKKSTGIYRRRNEKNK